VVIMPPNCLLKKYRGLKNTEFNVDLKSVEKLAKKSPYKVIFLKTDGIENFPLLPCTVL
jgi:hypothetical protein